jgi:DNA-binding transcriptional ArsR family regulator
MDLFAAISEPNRRRLLNGLLSGPQPVSALVDAVGMSQPVVSKHLRVLRDAGLVSVEPDGQRRLYSINAEPLAELDDWLKPYRKFWSAKLDALERHLGKTAKREKK